MMKEYQVTRVGNDTDFKERQIDLVHDFAKQIVGAKVKAKDGQVYTIKSTKYDTFDTLVICVQNAAGDVHKCFGLTAAMNSFYLQFEDDQLNDLYDEYNMVNTTMRQQLSMLQVEINQELTEAIKKREEQKKADARRQKTMESSIAAFEEMATRKRYAPQQPNDYFYMLGWLAKHIGTISATLPEYLESAFIKYFGADAVHTTVDSSRKTSGGYAMQWSWAFKASIKKTDTIPSRLVYYMNDSQKAITNTAFIWEIIDTWGFKFGKKQDIEVIKEKVPADCMVAFEEGLDA